VDAPSVPAARGFHLAARLWRIHRKSIKRKKVTDYIARQKQHHQKISFRDEFIEFLVANEIEFDERYI